MRPFTALFTSACPLRRLTRANRMVCRQFDPVYTSHKASRLYVAIRSRWLDAVPAVIIFIRKYSWLKKNFLK